MTGLAKDATLDAFLVKTSAGGDLQWSRLFGGPGDDYGQSVIQAPDGGYVMAGVTSPSTKDYTDIYLLKTDEGGNTQWSRSFGTSGPDQGNAVITTDGGYLLAGTVYASDNSGYTGCDGYVVKVSSEGKQLWDRKYIEPGMYCEQFFAIRETSDGNYVIAGTVGNIKDNKICLVLIDRNGDQIWTRSYDTKGKSGEVGDVRQMTDGGYVITGSAEGYFTHYLLRTDRDGNVLWFKEYDTFGRSLCGTVECLNDGGFIAGGACIVRTDKDGNLLWAELTDGRFNSYRTAVVANADGSYTVAGGVKTQGDILEPILLKTMPVENVTGIAALTTGLEPFVLASPGAGWITIMGVVLGIFAVVAGVIILLVCVVIVDERVNNRRKR